MRWPSRDEIARKGRWLREFGYSEIVNEKGRWRGVGWNETVEDAARYLYVRRDNRRQEGSSCVLSGGLCVCGFNHRSLFFLLSW